MEKRKILNVMVSEEIYASRSWKKSVAGIVRILLEMEIFHILENIAVCDKGIKRLLVYIKTMGTGSYN